VLAKHLLKSRAVWVVPVIVGSILLLLMTVFYIGSVVDPVGHLRGLPVSIVNEDAGASIGAKRVDVGDQLQSALTGSSRVSKLLALKRETLVSAEGRMNRDGAYAALVIPPDFTASVLSLAGVRLSPGNACRQADS
jgi:YhgE/Pip-like protein